MAEIIGIASGCLALANFAITSSITLYDTIGSFKSHSQRVRDLSDELDALSGVLKSLVATINGLPNIDFSALKFPLLRCGKACEDFESELKKCTARSTNDRVSFRDWAKLRYMGEDIDGFRRLLSSYKMTITVALTDANLRQSSATAEDIEAYNELLNVTRTDLEDQLDRINDKLDLIGDTLVVSQADADELKAMKDERTSTEKCLQVCARLSEHITQIQLLEIPHSNQSNGSISPAHITTEGLQECKNKLARITESLERYEKSLFDRLLKRTKTATISDEDRDDLVRLRDEWEATRQSMDICSQAHDHLKTNVSTIENYAAGDAIQFMVSTSEKTIHGKNRGVGWRTRQVGGHIDSESLQQMMRSLEVMDLPTRATGRNTLGDSNATNSTNVHEDEGDSRFQTQFGKGFKLSS